MDIIDNVARGFDLPPIAARRLDGQATPLAAATFRGQGRRIVSSAPDARYAIAAIHLEQPFEVDLDLDADRVFAGLVQPGQFVLVPPGTRPEAEVAGAWSVLHLYLPVDLVRELNPDWQGHTGRGPWYGARAGVSDLAQRAVTEMGADDPLARFQADATLRHLIARLVPALTRAPSPERLAPHILRRIQAVIDADHAGPLAVADLARAAGLAEAHFARAFRNTTGRTPGAAIRARRMATARHLLAATNLPVLEVAAAVGYADPGFFARLFRADHGLAPLAWRRSNAV
ncbi:MAG: AraC family transcriptional regulator [Pseudomonadota bacterium]